MVNSLMKFPVPAAITALVAAMVLVLACAGPPAAPEPTATPPPDPAALLTETAANLRAMQSTDFHVTHESGSIYIRAFSAKITEVTGSWDADLGADLTVDAYLVSSPEAEPESGTYVKMEAVIMPDGYYSADPLSGAWIKQPSNAAPIPAERLHEIIADLLAAVADPSLAGQETVDDTTTYKITGAVPASTMDWLPITAEAGQTLQVEAWTDTDQKLLRRLRATGAVGEFDDPDTVRSITLTGINEPVAIEPPNNFIDLTGG